MKGRMPKPSALVALHGRTNRARKPPQAEPKPTGNLAAPPKWMSAEQVEGWNYAVENAPLGLMKHIDRTTLAVWVVAENLHWRAAVEVSERGMLVRASAKDPESTLVPNPSLSILNKQALILVRVGADLGFSPASRPRITQLPAMPEHATDIRQAAGGGSVVSLDEYLASAPPD